MGMNVNPNKNMKRPNPPKMPPMPKYNHNDPIREEEPKKQSSDGSFFAGMILGAAIEESFEDFVEGE